MTQNPTQVGKRLLSFVNFFKLCNLTSNLDSLMHDISDK